MRKRLTSKPELFSEDLQGSERQRRLRTHQPNEVLAGQEAKLSALQGFRRE
jgi:hypothetical protein